jgi:hypothetical protein
MGRVGINLHLADVICLCSEGWEGPELASSLHYACQNGGCSDPLTTGIACLSASCGENRSVDALEKGASSANLMADPSVRPPQFSHAALHEKLQEALRGETKGSKIKGKMGVKWDSRDGLDGHQRTASKMRFLPVVTAERALSLVPALIRHARGAAQTRLLGELYV